jgi:hypothetical protein
METTKPCMLVAAALLIATPAARAAKFKRIPQPDGPDIITMSGRIEELPAVRALGAWMQIGDKRFDGDDIQRLYESDDFPLRRRLSE